MKHEGSTTARSRAGRWLMLRLLPGLLWSLPAAFALSALPAAADQALSARWSHQQGKDEATRNQYDLGYTLNLSQQLTETMTLYETFRYSSHWRPEGRRQSYDPGVRLNIDNYLFRFDLQGDAGYQQRSADASQQRRHWEARWAGNWDDRRLPRLRLNYGETRRFDHHAPPRLDQTERRAALALAWGERPWRLQYRLNRNWQQQPIEYRDQVDTNQFLRLDGDGRFFADRLRLGFSQQYHHQRQQLDSAGRDQLRQPATVAEVLLGRHQPGQELDQEQFTAADQLPANDREGAAALTTDGIDSPPWHLLLRLDYQPVNQVYLYTGEELAPGVAADFSFALYGSDDGVDFQRREESLAMVYNPADQRFELTLPQREERWLALVITASSLVEVAFTGLAASRLLTVVDEQHQFSRQAESHLSDLRLAYRLSEKSSFDSGIAFEQGDYLSGQSFQRRRQHAQFNWRPAALSSTLRLHEHHENLAGREDTLRRGYSLRLSHPLGPAADTSLGLHRTDNYVAGRRQRTSHEAGLYTSARLYPDLHADLDLTWHSGRQHLTGNTSRQQHLRLKLHSRLRPNLHAELQTDYGRERATAAAGRENSGGELQVNWRPSELLALTARGGKRWENGSSRQDDLLLQATMRPSRSTQLSWRWQHHRSLETTNRYTITGSWALAPQLTLQANTTYIRRGGEHDWRFYGQLSARYRRH
ncbi:hypothetical protein [Desulfurivibrio alkaliphilus]|uniref:Uncharacterized protein n=1 Tax=Desulfurivibrio alkaliphilus (strain DSM 19089 / UNIQEM U267 / AHT2) TaxID=589865 RepID=D6Z1N9_DESAT|nr:hypothetical protein [Desulfurivibrio alkaliphilus]ADH85464.1 hypothetical protein DaAHT2_0760 [Desulfurivibrio alkaliphilus AHT 2]